MGDGHPWFAEIWGFFFDKDIPRQVKLESPSLRKSPMKILQGSLLVQRHVINQYTSKVL